MALDYSIIGERIRKARLENNITQEKLAEELDVSIAFVSRIECGTTHINLKRLSQICNILNIKEGVILNGTNVSSDNYLSKEFNELFLNCSKDTQKLIYDIAMIEIIYHMSFQKFFAKKMKKTLIKNKPELSINSGLFLSFFIFIILLYIL